MTEDEIKLKKLTDHFESLKQSWKKIEQIRPEQIGTGGVKEAIEMCKKARDEAEATLNAEKRRQGLE